MRKGGEQEGERLQIVTHQEDKVAGNVGSGQTVNEFPDTLLNAKGMLAQFLRIKMGRFKSKETYKWVKRLA